MRKPREKTIVTSYRLTVTAMNLLSELSTQMGITRTAIIEMAIRNFYKKEKDDAR